LVRGGEEGSAKEKGERRNGIISFGGDPSRTNLMVTWKDSR